MQVAAGQAFVLEKVAEKGEESSESATRLKVEIRETVLERSGVGQSTVLGTSRSAGLAPHGLSVCALSCRWTIASWCGPCARRPT